MDKAAKDAEQVVLQTEKKLEEGQIDTTETPARYLGLLARIRPVLQPASRYLACESSTSSKFDNARRQDHLRRTGPQRYL